MHRKNVSLDDKYISERGEVLIGGVQALVRLPLDQIRYDRRIGLKTAGFISGYRGSPLGGYDQQLMRAKALMDEHGVHFEPGTNEDLAATAVWGSQQVNLHPGAKVDGVFGLWYGKGPGVDRTGDVFRHANMTGTWSKGGVLAIAGDDPLAKSSSIPCQSEFAFVDAEMPILTPSDIQEVLDLGLHGIAMSRHSGLWTGMIALADLMDGSATVNVDPHRLSISVPESDDGERHITLKALQLPYRQASEQRLRDLKIPAALDYARANRLNQVVWDSGRAARLGIAASGKNWQALLAALELLGIDRERAECLGLRLMKVSMPWPLEPESAQAFARGLETVLVVEAKRPLIETQLKEQLYHLDTARRPAILGKRDQFGAPLLSEIGDLSPMEIAPVLLKLLPSNDETKAMAAAFQWLQTRESQGKEQASAHPRTPHYCSGCPHSRSTRVPGGSRAMAGIGCHIMSQLMGGEERGFGPEDGFSQMGGEGVAWLGQTPFTETSHIFANLGDGTYHHSGLLAIRAAIAAKAKITYKILFNDAVAMTGGQAVDGPLTVDQIARQVRAEGVKTIAVVSEHPDRLAGGGFPEGVTVAEREKLDEIQRNLRETEGVSVLIFDQTCAAEKRRRRKKGQFPKAKKLAVINDRVCEGCGDCSLQSNCPSVEPVETAFGTKRRINQSSCNQDLSCTDGFCPSFITIEGATPKKPESVDLAALVDKTANLLLPETPSAKATANILITGIGGTGVTTVTAILAMAAHIDGRRTTTLDITGLAQKGGAVISHLRLGPRNKPLFGAKIAPGQADLVLASDLVVTAGPDCLPLCSPDRTSVIIDEAIMPTAAFIREQSESYRDDSLIQGVQANARDLSALNISLEAERLFGDAIYSNLMLVGAAYQQGSLPLSLASIEQAIALNGVAVDRNRAAFHAGRLLTASPERLPHKSDQVTPIDEGLGTLTGRLAKELEDYADAAYADRFRSMVATVRLAETTLGTGSLPLTEAVSKNLFKLMAYKDEYEVARLHSDPGFRAQLREQLGANATLSIHLAPPLLSKIDPITGRPKKRSFGPWIFPVLAGLAKLKRLRGTWLDPFGWMAERRLERQLIEDYERMLNDILPSLSPGRHETAVDLAKVPEKIRGFGPVKAAAIERAKQMEHDLLAAYNSLDEANPADDQAWLIAAE